ncbi:MAG: DUF721 domain-containing protein [Rickettsiales bacterium]|jgi:hypothetical protein|nr:DUF721 domain-containing protein [Rickettsiales bacterium]
MSKKSTMNEGIGELSEDYLEKPVAPIGERYARGPDSLANRLAGVIRKFAPKYGFISADIILNWEAIAGAEVARMAAPHKISFPRGRRQDGTLFIRLKNSSFAAVIQYRFPAIIDRVNTYFGYNAVAKILVKR